MASVFLTTVAPSLGNIVSALMYLTPVMAVWRARRDLKLGDLNPIPFAVTFVNASLWIGYGFADRNPYMFGANIIGFCAALYNSMCCFALTTVSVQNLMLSVMCTASVLVPALGVISAFGMSERASVTLLWGLTANIVTMGYYAAPLSSAFKVIKTKDSSSIHMPTCSMNMLNATLWTSYGLAVKDYWIYAPNGVGAVLTVGLLLLGMIYPRSGSKGSSKVVRNSSQDTLLPIPEASSASLDNVHVMVEVAGPSGPAENLTKRAPSLQVPSSTLS